MAETIWSGACTPHLARVKRKRRATALDMEAGHKEGSWVEYMEDSTVAVAVRVIRIDGHRIAVDAIDAQGRVVAALALREGHRRSLDRQTLDRLPAFICGLLNLRPV